MRKPAGLPFKISLLLALVVPGPTGAQDAPQPDAPSVAGQSATPAVEGTSGAPEEKGPTQAVTTLDLSTPRATMRTFLVAVQAADADHPERIDDAVRCLDISELEEEDRSEAARSRARRLQAVIDKIGVKLDDIPEEVERDTARAGYLFFKLTDEEAPSKGTLTDEEALSKGTRAEIRLTRDPATGDWRFTPLTLASIPALEAGLARAAASSETPAAPSEIPAARRSARATMTTFLEAMNRGDVETAVDCLDPAGQNPEAWDVRGKDLATKLKNVMDKIKLVVLTEIPDAPDGEPYVWYTSDAGNIVIARIEEKGEHTGEWRFTPATLKTLDALYLQFENKPIISELQEAGVKEELSLDLWIQRRMPTWLRTQFWHLQGWQWVALMALLPLGWVVQLVAAAVVMLVLGGWLMRRRIRIDREVQRRALRSSGAVVTMLFWLYAVKHLQLPEGLLGALLPMTRFGLVVTAVWVGYRIVDVLGGHIAADKEIRLTQFDDVLIPLLQKILRLFVVLVVVLVVLAWMGKPPTTVLGALGIGGVAVAFAAQDTLGNFFGSITVLFDRPFGIGDWIVIGDIEGTVERVGFRSTRVRTFYNSMVTIPNSRMVNTNVDNYGARQYRRVRIMISITYATPPDKIDAFCEGIRELIRLHPYTRKDYYHVYLNQFAPSSLDILLYAFFEVPDWGTELRERHRLFVDIIKLARELGVEFAFPTQTVWLQRAREDAHAGEHARALPAGGDPYSVGLDVAAAVFEDSCDMTPAHRGPVVIHRAPLSKRARGDTDAGDRRV